MANIGRNDPCPCGSGRKFKKCCLVTGGGPPYTAADRMSALQRLIRASSRAGFDEARDRFWGDKRSVREQWRDDHLLEMAEIVFQWWFFFDEVLDGETLAEDVLAHEQDLRPGERRYLEMGRESAMRLYEVVAVEPGASIMLRDIILGSEICVRERSASRSIHTWDLVAARIFSKGTSGQPEIDGGMLPLQRRLHDFLIERLAQLRNELDAAELREAQVLVFFNAWLDPGMPKLVNYDGEPILPTTVHFDVFDERACISALDHAPDIVRDENAPAWAWVGMGKDRKDPVTFGFLRLDGGRLQFQTNSRERGERGRSLIEKLVGEAVRYRVTEHEDIERAALAASNEREARSSAIPKELAEPTREAVMQVYQQHYEKWIDEPVPMLGGKTPRQAAGMAALRTRVAEMIEDLERMYETALVEGSAAYDPTWMWEELGIEDLARGRWRKQKTP